jgi:uncharacterized protein YkwD
VPVKTHKSQKKHAKHYAKVYWPYLPLVLLIAAGLVLGQPFAARSQRGVLSYATNVSINGLLDSTNAQRTKGGQSSLGLNTKLDQAAQAKANDMVKRNYWSHNTPDNQEPWIFIKNVDYNYAKAGENLAYGFADSNETIAGWMNSPSHKANLLDGSFKEVGFGIASSDNYQNNGPETVVVAMYGQPADQNAVSLPVADTSPTPPVTTNNSLAQEPSVKSISKIQALTDGRAPWLPFGLGLLSGLAIFYLLIHHGLAIRKAIRGGEKYVLSHPLFDITIVTMVAVCTLLGQNAGFIR